MLVLNFMLEIIAVPFSLSLRLFANISSEDRLLFKFAELNVLFKGLPFLFQIFVNILALIFSFVQAFVFTLLSTVYLSLIMPHNDHGPSESGREAEHPVMAKASSSSVGGRTTVSIPARHCRASFSASRRSVLM